MAVDNFSKKDLVGEGLNKLLAELDKLARSGEKEDYEKLSEFVKKFYTEIASQTQIVDRDGRKSIKVGDQEIDVSNSIGSINDIIDAAKDNVAYDSEQYDAREELFKTMSGTIGIMLKQDEIMNELASRGISYEELEENANQELAKSDAIIKELEEQKAEYEASLKLFGTTLRSRNGVVNSKSKYQILEDDKKAVPVLEAIEEKLETIGKIKDVIKKMDPSSREYAANASEIEKLIGDLKGNVAHIKGLDLDNIDVSELEKVSINTEVADISGLISDVDSKIVEYKNTIIPDDYQAIRNIIVAKYPVFGYPNDATAQSITDEDIEKIYSTLKSEIAKVNKEIRSESQYKKETTSALDKYKSFGEKHTELEGKLKSIEVPYVNEHGEYTDADGNVLPEGEAPHTYTQYVYTDDALNEKFKAMGIDDVAKYRKQEEEKATKEAEEMAESDEAKETAMLEAKEAIAEKKQEINGMKSKDARKKVRELYRRDGKLHPIKFLVSAIAPKAMLKSYYKEKDFYERYFAYNKAEAINNAVNEVNDRIDNMFEKDLNKDVNEYYKTEDVIRAVRNDYKKKIISAASQEKIAEELDKGGDTEILKEAVVGDASLRTVKNIDLVEAKVNMVYAQNALEDGTISEEEYNKASDAYKAAVKKNKENMKAENAKTTKFKDRDER